MFFFQFCQLLGLSQKTMLIVEQDLRNQNLAADIAHRERNLEMKKQAQRANRQ